MNVREAAALRVRAHAESETFEEACGAHEEDIKDALDGILGIFKNVLSSPRVDAYILRDGGYLYMRSSTSTRAINETRIASAVEAITVGQLKRLSEEPSATLVEVVCGAIDENLEDECISVSYTPYVAKRKPSTLKEGAACKTSTESIESAVEEFRKLREKLAALRKHKSGGKRRVNEVKEQTEPVLLAHMQEQGTKRQRIEIQTQHPSADETASTAESEPLPPLPVLLPTHQEGPSAAETVTVVLPNCEPKAYQLQRRTYTSRGKAPALAKFSESLKLCVGPVLGATSTTDSILRKWSTGDSKRHLTEAIVSHYTALFTESKGLPVEKLTLKCVGSA